MYIMLLVFRSVLLVAGICCAFNINEESDTRILNTQFLSSLSRRSGSGPSLRAQPNPGPDGNPRPELTTPPFRPRQPDGPPNPAPTRRPGPVPTPVPGPSRCRSNSDCRRGQRCQRVGGLGFVCL